MGAVGVEEGDVAGCGDGKDGGELAGSVSDDGGAREG